MGAGAEQGQIAGRYVTALLLNRDWSHRLGSASGCVLASFFGRRSSIPQQFDCCVLAFDFCCPIFLMVIGQLGGALSSSCLCADPGYLYTAFASQADYEYVLGYAKKLNVVLWENASRRCFFGSVEGHSNIRGFIERRSGGGH